MPQNMDRCIEDCGDCAVICSKCAPHCLDMGGEHASREHQNAMHDCAAICGLAVAYMARGSAHAGHLCGVCAEVCRACAESCGRLAEGDEMMTECARTCERCARSCEAMAGASSR